MNSLKRAMRGKHRPSSPSRVAREPTQARALDSWPVRRWKSEGARPDSEDQGDGSRVAAGSVGPSSDPRAPAERVRRRSRWPKAMGRCRRGRRSRSARIDRDRHPARDDRRRAGRRDEEPADRRAGGAGRAAPHPRRETASALRALRSEIVVKTLARHGIVISRKAQEALDLSDDLSRYSPRAITEDQKVKSSLIARTLMSRPRAGAWRRR